MKLTEPQPVLLPCPFCGSDAACFSWQDEDLWSHKLVEWQKVRCTGCECEGQSSCEGYQESETAVAAWNTRAPQWQPIESAPKDGARYLASDGSDQWVENCPPGCAPGNWSYHSGRWSGSAKRSISPASHWQPLPAPPEVEG